MTIAASRETTRHRISSGQQRPWIVIGLGKSGQRVTTTLKARATARYGRLPDHLRLLAYDSAPAIAPALVDGQPVGLKPNEEFFRLNDAPLAELWRHRQYHPDLAPYFALLGPNPRFESLEDGAGQNRVLPLIAFAHQFAQRLQPELRAALLALTDSRRTDWLRPPGVLVCGCCWGAHGSGLVQPAALGVRLVAEAEGIDLSQAPFWALVALPGGTDQATPLSDANTGATLLELSHFQDRGGLALPFPGRRVARCDGPTFDYVLLESVQGQDGSTLGTIDALFDMLAEATLLLTTSPVGDSQRGFARDHRAHLRRRGVAGDPACFSNLSVVAAELRRAPLLEFLEQTAVAQLAAAIVRPAGEPPKPTPISRLAGEAADVLRQLTASDRGRPFLPDFADEARVLLMKESPRERDLAGYLRELAGRFEKSRLPLVGERTAARAKALWTDAVDQVLAESDRLLAAGQLVAAVEFLEDAFQTVDRASLEPPALNDDEVQRKEAALAAAVRRSRLARGRGHQIGQARGELLAAYGERMRLLAERQAAQQWEAERAHARERLGDRLEHARALRDRLQALQQTARDRAAEALGQAARPDGEPGPGQDDLLRYPVLARRDAWRAYGEALADSGPAGLTEAGLAALRSRLGGLDTLLGLDGAGVEAKLLAAALPSFQVWRERDVEQALAWLGADEPAATLERLRALCVERWRYSTAVIPGGQPPHSIWALGVPDAERSAYTETPDLELVSTQDPDRLLLARLALGLPASALALWRRFQEAMAQAGDQPLFNLPDFETDPERAPNDPIQAPRPHAGESRTNGRVTPTRARTPRGGAQGPGQQRRRRA